MPANSAKIQNGDSIGTVPCDVSSSCSDDENLELDLKMLHVDSLALLEKATFKRRRPKVTVTSAPFNSNDEDDRDRDNKNDFSMSDEELYGWFLESKPSGDGDDNDDSLTFSESFSKMTLHNDSISNLVLQPAPRSTRTNAKDEKAAKTA